MCCGAAFPFVTVTEVPSALDCDLLLASLDTVNENGGLKQ